MRIFVVSVLVWVGFSASIVFGQQTIINVPSDALTPPGQFFSLHESQVSPLSASATFTTTNFLTYGLTDQTELAATLYGFDNFSSELAALGLGFKTTRDVFSEVLCEQEVKWTYGLMVPISLDSQAEDLGWFPYSHFTYLVPNTKLRLLSGVACGSENLFGERAISALAGAEYPLTEHLSFTGEWFSGQHNLSGLIPGFTYHKSRLIVVAGYKIPNNWDWNESGLILEVGCFFGPGARDTEHGSGTHYGLRTP